MPKAICNGKVIAESPQTEIVEGNHYFPAHSIKPEYFEKSGTESVCGWKGTASYYHVVVEGQRHEDAAWYYANPKPEAQNISGHVAFWKGVEVRN